jgi:hypothetical protein
MVVRVPQRCSVLVIDEAVVCHLGKSLRLLAWERSISWYLKEGASTISSSTGSIVVMLH